MATKMKKPRLEPRQEKLRPSRGMQQRNNRPEYESQVPGIIDRLGLEQFQNMTSRPSRPTNPRGVEPPQQTMNPEPRGAEGPDTMAGPRARGAAAGARAGGKAGARMAVPTQLKKKSKLKVKPKQPLS